MEYKAISADSHVNPLPSMWQEYTAPEFREKAPRTERRGEYEVMIFEGEETKHSLISTIAGRKYEDYESDSKSFEDGQRGGFDPKARISAQDVDNVTAEVLFGGVLTFKTADRPLRFALMQAYNDWLADFCSEAPDRLIGVAEIPTWDVELATSESKRARDKGLKGVLIPAIPNIEGPWSSPADMNYTNAWWDPLWDALEDMDMPAHMHLGAKPLTPGLDQNLFTSIVCNKAMMAEPITSLIFSGALRRHPKLKIVSVESGVGWMAFIVPWMDNVYERHRHWQKLDIGESPSYYFQRQVYGTFIEDPVGVRERHTIGLGNIMWSNDFPHSDSTWPHSMKAIEEHFAGVPEAETEMLVSSNARGLYDL